MTSADPKPVIMVSSTVYGIENLLEQIFGVLNSYGYEVWMSYKGTVPIDPRKSNFENCLDAVDNCDVFLGLITPKYGSGRDRGQLSITHQELLRAIDQGKLRWFLADDYVAFARQLLKQYRFNANGTPKKGFRFKPTSVMDDIRVVDMYEAAIRHDVKLAERTGNWVQPYRRDIDALEFVSAQFKNRERISQMIVEWREL
jgi:hypothetical protein